jgi:hypothetical protein
MIKSLVWIACGWFLLTACSSVNEIPKDLHHLKRNGASVRTPVCPAAPTPTSLKGAEGLRRTFAALLGNPAEHPVAERFFVTNHNRFERLEALARQAPQPGSTRMQSLKPYWVELKILAEAAAELCAATPDRSSCRCGTVAEARLMLERTLAEPSCAPRNIAESLAQACQEDYVETVSALFSSLPLARDPS